jgi:threonylcarbamoyladenosine tRNA methylthiotransferase MtaB
MFHPEEERSHRLTGVIFTTMTAHKLAPASRNRSVSAQFRSLRYHNCVATFHVVNFGCRATQADGAALERQFEARGLACASATHADFVLFNTCTVTASADQDARAAIRRVRRQNPSAKIVVTGCYAQRAPEEVAALPGVSAVIGNSHKHKLADIVLSDESVPSSGFEVAQRFCAAKSNPLLEGASASEAASPSKAPTFIPLHALTENALTENRELRPENRIYVSDIFAHTELLAAPVFDSPGNLTENARTRPNLKIQDGCDNRCSFCVIPSVRGNNRSLPALEVLREMSTLIAAGYREVVISGINLGRWGRDLLNQAPQSFEGLIHTILSETQLEKLRISSVEPMDWTDELITLVASSPRVAKHAHVPLQSGSDAVLRRMHRKYRPWHYREKIQKIRAAMPTAAIGADVMAGFPGETDAEFESTRRLIEDLPFTYLHVFTYSARPGTPAAALANQVPVHVARERNKVLRDLAAAKKLAFMQSLIGESLEAITLGSSSDLSSRAQLADSLANRLSEVEGPAVSAEAPFTEALTDNYQKLYLKGRYAANQWLPVRVENVTDASLIGICR